MSFRIWLRDALLTVLTLTGVVISVHACGLLLVGVSVGTWSKQDAARHDARQIARTIELFHLREGTCPSGDVFGVLVQREFLERRPYDPWTAPYRIDSSEGGFVIVSLGRDRKPGGEGQDADVLHPVSCPSE